MEVPSPEKAIEHGNYPSQKKQNDYYQGEQFTSVDFFSDIHFASHQVNRSISYDSWFITATYNNNICDMHAYIIHPRIAQGTYLMTKMEETVCEYESGCSTLAFSNRRHEMTAHPMTENAHTDTHTAGSLVRSMSPASHVNAGSHTQVTGPRHRCPMAARLVQRQPLSLS